MQYLDIENKYYFNKKDKICADNIRAYTEHINKYHDKTDNKNLN